MLLLFILVVIGVFVIYIKIPLLTMIFYLVATGVLYFYNKIKKNVNLNFILLALGLFGIIMFGSLFNKDALISTIAERQASLAHDSIYANTSYHTNMIYELSTRHYSVSILIGAGGFFIGTMPVTVDLSIGLIIFSYVFLFINVGFMVLSIYLIYKETKHKFTDDSFKQFLKNEKKRNLITQLISIIVINFFLILIMTNEELSIYFIQNGDSSTVTPYYVSASNIKEIMFGVKLLGTNIKVSFESNAALLLTYIVLVISIILLVVGKFFKKDLKRYTLIIIASGVVYLISSVLILLTNNFLDMSLKNCVIEGMTDGSIIISRDTNTFFIYGIVSTILIVLSYAYIIYYNIKKDIQNKKALEQEKIDHQKNYFECEN